jgi:hypothetical protein
MAMRSLLLSYDTRAREWFEKPAQENDCSPLMAAAASARLKQFGAQ